ncbi:MAG TPA: HAD family phosphatase [Vicinamibacterales bacterium]|nr:HAD family phosphatase [Vicinamibacterales bacterium]HPW20433.1 HAD family phosphatase [Vicinamibacterales bacterium]
MTHTLLPGLGAIDLERFVRLGACSDGRFAEGRDGVRLVLAPADRRVEFIVFEDRTLAYVRSALGYPAYYPVHPVALERPVRAVLMDLDGTTVRSEPFWVLMIERATGSLLGDPSFRLDESDLPFVSGFSVSEHLEHCIRKYCPDRSVEDARRCYFEHTHREMREILEGRGRQDAFVPAPGLKPFLLALKREGIRIGVVTSGLHEKAWPELVAAFRAMDLGDPRAFYDAIVTAGFPVRPGEAGTLGELSPKPHPWLYAEAARVGLGIPFDQRHRVVGIEDSGAGVCAIRLAGFTAFGMAGGTIEASGARPLCQHYCASFDEVLAILHGSV